MIRYKRIKYARRDRIHYLFHYYGPIVFVCFVVVFIILLITNSLTTPGTGR
jgi:hypothetical protein